MAVIVYNSEAEMKAAYMEDEHDGSPYHMLSDSDVVLIKQGHDTKIIHGPFTTQTDSVFSKTIRGQWVDRSGYDI